MGPETNKSVEIPEVWHQCEITGVHRFNQMVMPMLPIITGAEICYFDPSAGTLTLTKRWAGDKTGEQFPSFIQELSQYEGVEITFR